MSARAVVFCSNRRLEIAAFFAPMAMCLAHRFSKQQNKVTHPDVAPEDRTTG